MTYTLMPGNVPQIDKDPDASLIYGIDVADVLAEGDTLAGTPTAAASGGGVTVAGAGYSGTVVYARISGGTAGQLVDVTFTWTTAQGDTDQRTVRLRIVQR